MTTYKTYTNKTKIYKDTEADLEEIKSGDNAGNVIVHLNPKRGLKNQLLMNRGGPHDVAWTWDRDTINKVYSGDSLEVF